MGAHSYRDGEDLTPLVENFMGEEQPILADIPTQILYPWHTALRTLFQYVAGLVVTALIAWLAGTIGVDLSSLSGELVGSLAAVMWGLFAMLAARLMAIPGVNTWLERFVPFLAAKTPTPPRDNTNPAPFEVAPETVPELPDVVGGLGSGE